MVKNKSHYNFKLIMPKWNEKLNENAVRTACNITPILTATQSFQKWDSYK